MRAESANFRAAGFRRTAGRPALVVATAIALLGIGLPPAAPARQKPTLRELPQAPLAPGAAVDPGDFRCSRKLGALPAGWTVLALDAHVLSCTAKDLADLRLIDGKNRQIPYLLETAEEPLEIELPTPEAERDDAGRSRFRLELPYAELPGGRLVLTTGARVFERPVRLLRSASSRRGEALLAATVWRHDDPRAAAPALEFELPRRAGRELELEIDDADNAPLPLSAVRLELPARQLRFHVPDLAAESGLVLLYGRPRLPAPRYDLALLAGRAREMPAQAVYLPAPPRAAKENGWLASRGWIWAILGGTIVALLVLLARLLGGERTPPGSGKEPRGTD